jgi:pimeloyl-ACP methyl ester carboxylesterase
LTRAGFRLALALVAMLTLAGCPVLQDNLMFFPTRVAAADVQDVLRATPGLREWSIGGEWRGFVAEPAERDPSRPLPTALVFHGNAGWAADRLYYVEPLVRRGFRVVLAEYPGYGARTGTATVASLLAATERAIHDTLQASPGALVLVGESLGAGLIAEHAKRHEARLAGLVLVTPWDSLRNVAKMHYGWLPVDWLLAHPLDSVAALKGFSKPVSVLVAGRDEIVGAAGGRALAASLAAALVELPDAGHNDWLFAMTEREWDALLAPVREASSR